VIEHGGPCRVRMPDGTRTVRCYVCRARSNDQRRGKYRKRPPRPRQIVDEVVVERLLRGEVVEANGSEIREAARRRRMQ
jgi:hypothetical protein